MYHTLRECGWGGGGVGGGGGIYARVPEHLDPQKEVSIISAKIK